MSSPLLFRFAWQRSPLTARFASAGFRSAALREFRTWFGPRHVRPRTTDALRLSAARAAPQFAARRSLALSTAGLGLAGAALLLSRPAVQCQPLSSSTPGSDAAALAKGEDEFSGPQIPHSNVSVASLGCVRLEWIARPPMVARIYIEINTAEQTIALLPDLAASLAFAVASSL